MLLAALWCVDTQGVLPLFVLAAAVHELGHVVVLWLAGGRVQQLRLSAAGAALHCALPQSATKRAAICLAGPAASFALTALAQPHGWLRLSGASALLGLFNLLPLAPLDGGMALAHLYQDTHPRLCASLSILSATVLLVAGISLAVNGRGVWLLLTSGLVLVSAYRTR